ncbi:MAG: Glu/Leu/Phe/Val dehydrogenase [Thermodesulfobacteriota bacterium]|nr:Glu/Leu/Phe/Val dehydrogenase [Thermodesulfobacteriota bacterium]
MADVFEWMDEFGPEKIIVVHDTKTGMKGMVVIDNTARGPGKGGCRMDPNMTLLDCFRLARTMTWKWAMADIFLGGAKAGIRNDPKSPYKEEIIRAYVKKIRKFLPDEYVFGNDMGFAEKDGAIALDEAEDMRAAVGTPAELGGLPYDELGITGYGVVEAAECAAPFRGVELNKATVSIQGFGAVGAFAAKFIKEKGSKVLAVSSVEGSLYDPQGLDVDKLFALREKHGDKAVLKYGKGQQIPLGKELEVEVDILVPGATGDVITEKNMKNVKAKMIVEGANFPTADVAQKYFHEKGILVVPDFVANAGAVMGAGKAMDNRYSCDLLDPQEVYDTVKRKMWKNVAMVLQESKRSKRLPREVALAISKERVLKAMELRGRIPKKKRG